MPDLSELDKRYFIDDHVYNCPFCNRRNVFYHRMDRGSFDWSASKSAFFYVIGCSSCKKQSFHLSFIDLPVQSGTLRFDMSELKKPLDDCFFYSVPTSFFVTDDRIPRVLRELLTEAEGCLKSNFLTGASACARKLVYELAAREKAVGDNYDDRLKSLKQVRPDLDPVYVDSLLTIQQVTSSKVHEESYNGWSAGHLRLILATLHEILTALYVLPAVREQKRRDILALRSEVLGEPAPTPGTSVSRVDDEPA